KEEGCAAQPRGELGTDRGATRNEEEGRPGCRIAHLNTNSLLARRGSAPEMEGALPGDGEGFDSQTRRHVGRGLERQRGSRYVSMAQDVEDTIGGQDVENRCGGEQPKAHRLTQAQQPGNLIDLRTRQHHAGDRAIACTVLGTWSEFRRAGDLLT